MIAPGILHCCCELQSTLQFMCVCVSMWTFHLIHPDISSTLEGEVADRGSQTINRHSSYDIVVASIIPRYVL